MYTAFEESASKRGWPKWFLVWVLAAAVYVPMNLFFVGLAELPQWYWYIQALTWFPVLEVARGMSRPVKNGVSGAWVVGAGMLFYALYMALNTLILVRGWAGADFSIRVRSVVILFLTGAVSIFLARRFARASLDLEDQLAQVKRLSAAALEHEKVKAENERRARELEEASRLQLSMLPSKVPQLPHLDVAAYMKPATEVGGDYYDFHLGEDGALTVAVGDATGHGLKAGTMVAAVKGLFVTLAHHPDIPQTFNRLSRTLKQMNMRGLFMAMTIAKVRRDSLTVSIAGMPPVWIYRAASGEVEEVALRAVPLGGMLNYQYKVRELAIAPGDVVVLMSDGLPERFNTENEMLDYGATRDALAAAAHRAPREIIEHFVRVGDEWSNGRPQDDDVTFVVLKVRDMPDGSVDGPAGKRGQGE
jgi:serine phosphatase RsbU (regulator of sigma subunit)